MIIPIIWIIIGSTLPGGTVTYDWEFYFSMNRDSWYKCNLRLCELEFWLFQEREILFWISCVVWKGQIILHNSVVKKGIGGPYKLVCQIIAKSAWCTLIGHLLSHMIQPVLMEYYC